MIDLNDTIRIDREGGKYRTRYRANCDDCGCDRGYQSKSNARDISLCRNCCHKNMSEEKKQAISKANKGRISPYKGKKHTPEALKKISESGKGRSPPNKGTKLSNETKTKISCSVQGITLEEFDGFKTPLARKARSHLKSLELDIICFKNADYSCDICSIRGVELHAHHMNNWKFYPEERYEIANLVCLCKTCHRSFHNKYGDGKMTPNTKEQYQEFREFRKQKDTRF
jgi:ribosomal protein S14